MQTTAKETKNFFICSLLHLFCFILSSEQGQVNAQNYPARRENRNKITVYPSVIHIIHNYAILRNITQY